MFNLLASKGNNVKANGSPPAFAYSGRGVGGRKHGFRDGPTSGKGTCRNHSRRRSPHQVLSLGKPASELLGRYSGRLFH